MIGDKLATGMQLFGSASCINTAKCLQTAGEKGIDIESVTISSGEEVSDKSPLNSVPVLKDLDNIGKLDQTELKVYFLVLVKLLLL